MAEVRPFKMHENLLYNIIMRQAGSMEKAWLEGVMNSVDSGARNIEIKVDRYNSKIKDDGNGMDEDDIKTYFETFGLTVQPQEQKRYGEFRMGRGQLFAQGKNTWRTQNNVLSVDIKNDYAAGFGIRYLLSKTGECIDGCTVEVDHYTPLTTHEAEEKARILEKWTKYVPAKVTINGKAVTQDMGELFEGDGRYYYETETAKYGFDDRASGVNVYNQGIFVKTIWGQGIGGDISSKRSLKVNFARNDIMHYCPAWLEIQKELKEFRMSILNNKVNQQMTDENRMGIVNLMMMDEDAKRRFYDAKIFRTSNESWVSLSELEGADISFAKLGDVKADKATELSGIIFLDEGSMVDNVRALISGVSRIVSYKDATGSCDIPFSLVSESLLNPLQKRNLEIARYFKNEAGMNRAIQPITTMPMTSFTDGEKSIFLDTYTLDLPLLAFLADGLDSIIHEYSHDKDTRLTNVHGETFLKRFYDNVVEFSNARVKTIKEYLKEEQKETMVPEKIPETPQETPTEIKKIEKRKRLFLDRFLKPKTVR